jgi:hypothetical protein
MYTIVILYYYDTNPWKLAPARVHTPLGHPKTWSSMRAGLLIIGMIGIVHLYKKYNHNNHKISIILLLAMIK